MNFISLPDPSSIVSISDIHVRSSDDSRYQILLSFLQDEKTKQADLIVLLGDIFDLMVGLHFEYFEWYKEFFLQLEMLLLQNKKIVFVAGNHDFHLGKLFRFFNDNFQKKYFKKNNIIYVELGFEVLIGGNKKIFFTHGHELVPRKWKSISYLSFINGHFSRLIANEFVSLATLTKIGKFLASKSDRHYSIFVEEQGRAAFRLWIEPILRADYDLVVCGHSHIEDLFFNQNQQLKYANNGFSGHNSKFLYLDLNPNTKEIDCELLLVK